MQCSAAGVVFYMHCCVECCAVQCCAANNHYFLGPWANFLLKPLGVDLQLKVCIIHEIFES